MLEVRGLHAGYGQSEVLFGIDLAVGSGEIVGVLGRNGMGKTTLVRTIMGLLRPSAGSIALVPEGRQLFPNLSVDEHLSAFGRCAPDGRTHWTPQRAYALFPRLQQRRGHMGNQLSGGEQQMLAIARALVTNPRLLILDEATEGLAPLVREEIWNALTALRAAGHAMIVIDKYARRLMGIADRALVIEKGCVVWSGSAAELGEDARVSARYLGL